MQDDLTYTQRRLYAAIVDYRDEYGYAPTYEELMPLVGVASKGTIAANVEKLKELGYLRHTPKNTPRALVPC